MHEMVESILVSLKLRLNCVVAATSPIGDIGSCASCRQLASVVMNGLRVN